MDVDPRRDVDTGKRPASSMADYNRRFAKPARPDKNLPFAP